MIDLSPMLAAVRQAADLTRRVQQTHFARAEKAGHEPVTIADYGSQAILLRALAAAYPDDAVLAEERGSQFAELVSDEGRAEVVRLVGAVIGEAVSEAQVIAWLDHGRDREAARAWLIDPVDGTKGFIAGRRYSIAAGLVIEGLPVAGIVGSPGYPSFDGRGLLFYAQLGQTLVEPMSGGRKAARVAVSTRSAPSTLKVVQSVEKANAALEVMAQIYAALGIPDASVESVDSQDKYAMIACGDADLSMRLPREANPQHKVWDHGAGLALVQAAGGTVTDLDGSPLDFSHGALLAHNKGMVISNGLIHDKVLEAIAPYIGKA